MQAIESAGGPEELLKSLTPPTNSGTSDTSESTASTGGRGIMNPIIYLQMTIKILPDLPQKDFYLVTASTEDGTLEGSGVGYLPGAVGATLNKGSCTYHARPGVEAVLPPNDVTFKWVQATNATNDADLCACEVYSNGKIGMRLGGWAAGESALIGTHGVMHWAQKPREDV
ncbi:hypothetical protein FRC04_004961 [Tulasnella sp. 424]|nr:hypothetical protein FRC04_004961 [Tulasnella sp. 424]KAG8970178.1 hypothetical protein FRC05_000699 [Tulasnella sp. 425]